MLILVLPILMLGATAAASVILAVEQDRTSSAARAAGDTSDSSSALLVSLLNAETGVRGYVSTGDPVFLQPWHWARRALPRQVAELSGRPLLGARTRRQLWAQTRTERRLLDTLLAAELRTPRPSHAFVTGHLLAAKAEMDSLRRWVNALQSRVRVAQAADESRVARLRTALVLVALAGLITGVAVVIGAYLFIRRIVIRLRALQADARRLGIGERLAPATISADEIGQLSGELRRASDLLASRGGELVQAHRAALAAISARDEFFAQIAHELRTPLTAVAGFAQLLEGSPEVAGDDADYVTQIQRAADHLIALTDEVDDPDRSLMPLSADLDLVALGPVLDEVCRLMSPLAAGRQIDVIVSRAPDAVAVANRRRLTQVLINLVSNAIKYNRQGGLVELSAEPLQAGGVRLSVRDTGIGIRADLQPRVFAPYDRLDAGAGDITGSGIGLALSRTYVESMGGSIAVTSVEGEGTTFRIDLTAAPVATLQTGAR